MEIFAIISTVVAVIGVIGTIFFFLTSMNLVGRLREAEEIITDKNDVLKDAFDAIHVHNDKLWELEHELSQLKVVKRSPGRPKGAKNKLKKTHA